MLKRITVLLVNVMTALTKQRSSGEYKNMKTKCIGKLQNMHQAKADLKCRPNIGLLRNCELLLILISDRAFVISFIFNLPFSIRCGILVKYVSKMNRLESLKYLQVFLNTAALATRVPSLNVILGYRDRVIVFIML